MTGDLPVVCPYVETSVKTAVRATSPGAFVFISSPQQDRGSDSHGGGAYL